MKHTSAAQQRSTVWCSLKSSQLEYMPAGFHPFCAETSSITREDSPRGATLIAKRLQFELDHALGVEQSQQETYDATVRDKVASAVNGCSVTVLACTLLSGSHLAHTLDQ